MDSKRTVEIGITHYPGVQLAAVHGLIDMFEVANGFISQHNPNECRVLRVSQWRSNAAGEAPVREMGSSGEDDMKLTALLLPPSLNDAISREDAEPFVDWILKHHRAGTTIASLCGGVFVLAETGLLCGRTATTHWARADIFRRRFPDVLLDVDRLIIDDGDIICAGGLMAWIDLGLTLVDRFLGPTVMAETARFLLVDPPGREQRYYSVFAPNLSHGDSVVLKVQRWLEATGAAHVVLASLASRAGLEERTFLRRFRNATGFTPIDYCQRLRVEKARGLLQFTSSPIEAVAWAVNYSDVGAFRKTFSRVTGLTPGEYRQRFFVSPNAVPKTTLEYVSN